MKKLLIILFCIPFLAFSESEKRLALVIGNSNYDKGPLDNPVNDALLMAQTLEVLDFDIILDTNIESKESFISTIREFGNKRADYDVAFVYYAGHGIQVGAENFLLPTKTNFKSEYDVIDFGVSVQNIMRYLTGMTNQVNILILDACRDNPFEGNWNKKRSLKGSGLAKIPPPTGSLIAFSTDAGNTASDGDGKNSIYCESLCKNMLLENTSLDQVFRNVRSDVLNSTNGVQRPVESSQLTGSVYYLNKASVLKLSKLINDLILDDKLKEAMNLANFLVFKFPDNSKGYTKRGHIYSLQNKVNDAVENYKKAIELNPLEYEAYWMQVFNSKDGITELGLETIYNDHYEPQFSIDLLNQLIAQDKYNPCAYQEIARVFNWQMDMPKKALNALDFAIDSIPTENYNSYKIRHYIFHNNRNVSIMASLLINIAYVLDARDKENEIISLCKKAIEFELKEDSKSKNIGWMYNMISDAYYSIGNYQKSLENLNFAITNISSEPVFYISRANSHLKLGNLDLANQDFDYSVNTSPNLYAKIFNLFKRAAFYKEDINLPVKSLFDFTEIINILHLNNSLDFISQVEKNKLLSLAYSGRAQVLNKLKFLDISCEDFKNLCNLGDCEMFNVHCE